MGLKKQLEYRPRYFISALITYLILPKSFCDGGLMLGKI